MSNNNFFWTGPFGIRANEQIYQIPSRDGVNWVNRDGSETEMGGGKPLMDEKTYLAKYGTKDEQGQYWYVPKPIDFCGGDGSRPAFLNK